MKKQGKRTRDIVKKLEDRLTQQGDRFSGVKIFYAHGIQSKKSNVCHPTTYMGRRYGSDAKLSVVDIVLVKGDKVFAVIEIEESLETRPKTILGDIFGVILADKIRIQDKSFPMRDASLIVALVISSKGKRQEKYLRLKRHINKFLVTLREGGLSCNVRKVRIVPCPLDDLVRRLERLIRREVGKEAR